MHYLVSELAKHSMCDVTMKSIDNGFTPSFGHNITGPALFQQLEKNRNKCLPVLFDCLDGQCEIDCTVGEWSKCTAACGGGTQSRLVEAEVFGGKKCKSYNTKQVCNTAACPIDCQLTDWSNCSEPCGKGHRTRSVQVHANFAGEAHNTGDGKGHGLALVGLGGASGAGHGGL